MASGEPSGSEVSQRLTAWVSASMDRRLGLREFEEQSVYILYKELCFWRLKSLSQKQHSTHIYIWHELPFADHRQHQESQLSGPNFDLYAFDALSRAQVFLSPSPQEQHILDLFIRLP